MIFFFFPLVLCYVGGVRFNNSAFIVSTASFRHHYRVLRNETLQQNVTADHQTSENEWSTNDHVILYLMVLLSLFVGYLLLVCIKQPTWMEHKYRIIKKR